MTVNISNFARIRIRLSGSQAIALPFSVNSPMLKSAKIPHFFFQNLNRLQLTDCKMVRNAEPNANYRSMSVIVLFYVLAEKKLPHSVVILKRTAGSVKNASDLFYQAVSNSDYISEHNQELAVKINEL
jgi:hypothetical protein